MKNYYEILEVNETASKGTIEKVYKFLAKKYHPDTNPNNKEEAETKFKEIGEAYEILSDNDKRSEYDIELKKLKDSENSNYINYEDYNKLKEYCIELEQQLQNLKNSYSTVSNEHYQEENSYNPPNTYTNTNNYNEASQKAYDDTTRRAYNEAYINTLKNLGYKIKYKKTLKEHFKNFISLLLTFIILFVLFTICWRIPPIKKYFLDLFSNIFVF